MNQKNIISNIPAQFGAEAYISFTHVGNAVDVRLTRPKALNALTHKMALALHAGLQAWRNDGSITHVLIIADTGDKRAFCAGGDIRDLYEGFQAGSPRHAFFRDEYCLNDAIATFPKPYIALMDGMVMGGGAGISMHGSQRIVTENTRFAMPEVGIGLIPDVGGSYVLPRLANQFGFFLGLTGTVIGPEECLEAEIGTHFCESIKIEDLRSNLLASQNPDSVLQKLRILPRQNLLQENAHNIAKVFSAATLNEVIEHLEQKSLTNPFFASALERVKAASPLSLCLAFEQLQRGKYLSLRQGLIMEYQLVSRILLGPDLYEGIRAAIIDRTTPPKWQHLSIEDVDSGSIASFFRPPPEGDLTFEN
jgi:enoyl-CoA hydratase